MNMIVLLIAAAATALTTEYRVNPIGIDAAKPRLSWKLPAGVKSQSAYEIEINGEEFGRVESDRTLNIEWPGYEIKSGERVEWRVKFWDERGKSHGWSDKAHFTAAIMRPEDWSGAEWIGMDRKFRCDERFEKGRWIAGKTDANGAMHFKKTFSWDGEIKGEEYVKLVHLAKPRHEVRINGQKVYEYRGHVNGWNYAKYNDITKALKKGENTIEVDVLDWRTNFSPEVNGGDSMSKGVFAAEFKVMKPEAFIAEIRFPDGSVVGTDESWQDAKIVEVKDRLEFRLETKEPAFAKEFDVKGGIRRATLFITGLGYYEARLNGIRVGEKVLDPSPTEFNRHVMYSTYHVEDLLKKGGNRIDVLVGHGWYDITTQESWDFSTAPWKDTPKLIAKLDIEYGNGKRETIVSDASWRQVESPLRYDCVRDGEIIDARIEAGNDLASASVVAAPGGQLVAENQPGSRIQRTLKPVSVRELEPGLFAVKFPENIAGWARLRFEDQDEGDVIEIRYDERSYDEIRTNTRAGRAIDAHVKSKGSCRRFPDRAAKFQSDLYICRGKDDVYEPRFTYNGFQYLLIKGLVHAPTEITACVIHTDFRRVGEITTSNADLNALLEAAEHSYYANFANGYPMDCPHREKNGWTGDAAIASELAQYLVENTPAYEKYLVNICDTQNDLGDISCIAPSGGWGFSWGNGPGWDSALYTIAWNLYLYRGDERILDVIYPYLAKYLVYTATKADADGLVKHGLGDWIPVVKAHMPTTEYTSSCYYLQAQQIAAKIAMKKGFFVSAMNYGASARKTRSGIRARYMKDGGVFDNGGQTAQAMALAFGLYEPDEKDAVIAKLVESVEKTDYHVDMGLFGTKWVFRELARNGQADAAFKTILNPTTPTMLDWLRKSDGNTLWEDWGDGQSRNHIMFGDFYAVAYQYLAGIRLKEREGSLSAVTDAVEPAFKDAVIAPTVIDALDNITATLDTPYGLYQSAWERKDGKIAYFFEIPSGCRAEIRLPGREPEVLGPGRWTR